MTYYKVNKGNKTISIYTNINTAKRCVHLGNKNEIKCKREPNFWLEVVER